jgi:uncharacterized damage-inducible protein DinB
MNEYFIRLYKGNYWANATFLESSISVYDTNKYIAETFSHVINAQFIWMSRIKGEKSPYKVREIHSIETLRQIIPQISKMWIAYLENATPEEYNREIHYTNSFGESFTSKIIDIVSHLISHSHYHRGQCNAALRKNGVEPINIDFITYCRLLDADKIDEQYR